MISKAVNKFVKDFKKLPERKQYVEFFTALLTVPVLLTVIILNVTNLRADKETDEAAKGDPVQRIIITQPGGGTTAPQTTDGPCIEEIGPIAITSPEEDDTVSENPVQVSIRYDRDDYCAVVWSYRVNGGRWSDYDDNSIALFNPPRGEIKFELRVRFS